VGANHGADATIKESSHCDLLARRLGVHVDENDGRLLAEPRYLLVHDEEGILERRVHERAPLGVHHRDLDPRTVRKLEHDRAVAGSAGWVVNRTEETRLGVEVRDDLPLVPDMIATGDDSDTAAQKIDADLRRNPAPSRRVFTVHDDEIDPPFHAPTRDRFYDGFASGFANDVTEE
jgi:hypothetical protein